MKKATSRILMILVIFVGMMLLLMQLLVGTAVAAQQTPEATPATIAANHLPITTPLNQFPHQ